MEALNGSCFHDGVLDILEPTFCCDERERPPPNKDSLSLSHGSRDD